MNTRLPQITAAHIARADKANRPTTADIDDLPPNVLGIATRGAVTPYGMLGRCTLLDGQRGYALRLALGSAHEWIITPDTTTPALTARMLTRAAADRYSLFLERVRSRAAWHLISAYSGSV